MTPPAPQERPRPAILLSFFYHQTTNMDEFRVPSTGALVDLMADSGAFSAHSLGKEVRLEDYMAWADQWKGHFKHFIALDVIGDHEGSLANLDIFRREMPKLSILPVWHIDEPWEVLDHYLDTSEYVCIGGMASNRFGADNVMRACLKAHQRARAKGVKLHGLGQTRWDQLTSLPWHSVDSSSWTSGARYGMTVVWDEKAKKTRQIQCGTRGAHRWGAWLRDHGFDPKVLTLREGFDYKTAVDCSAWTFHKLEAYLAQRWQNPDFNLYFATSPPEFGRRAVRVIDRLHTEKGPCL